MNEQTPLRSRKLLYVGAGLAAGVAAALVLPLAGPVTAAPTPDPQASEVAYPINADGLSYGSAADATSGRDEPSLIEVEATNGAVGYVYRDHLDEATGVTAMAGFRSPEEAVEWQATVGQEDQVIAVYEADGRTVVGEFVVFGQASIEEQNQQYGVAP